MLQKQGGIELHAGQQKMMILAKTPVKNQYQIKWQVYEKPDCSREVETKQGVSSRRSRGLNLPLEMYTSGLDL